MEQIKDAWEKRIKLRAEGDKLYAESDKLYAEGDKLYAEANLVYICAVIAAHGPKATIDIDWSNGTITV
jgi:hypothetical protein